MSSSNRSVPPYVLVLFNEGAPFEPFGKVPTQLRASMPIFFDNIDLDPSEPDERVLDSAWEVTNALPEFLENEDREVFAMRWHLLHRSPSVGDVMAIVRNHKVAFYSIDPVGFSPASASVVFLYWTALAHLSA